MQLNFKPKIIDEFNDKSIVRPFFDGASKVFLNLIKNVPIHLINACEIMRQISISAIKNDIASTKGINGLFWRNDINAQ